jgi:hypothetical protein
MQDATTIEVFDEAGRLDCGYEFHVVLARTAVDFRGNAELEVIRQVSVRRHKLVAVSFKNVERLQNTVTTALQLKPSGKTKLIAITGTDDYPKGKIIFTNATISQRCHLTTTSGS